MMTSETTQPSPIKRALLALEDMQAKLEAVEAAKHEPIAIIGIGCRFPGNADSPERFWNLLNDGIDAITEVPKNRWNIDEVYDPNPDVPGKVYTRLGGFLPQVDEFDRQFFGISARECVSLDPQQRLLLEVSWEALENAYCRPEDLSKGLTGVFIGICNNDYAKVIIDERGRKQIDAYFGTGNATSIAAGRLSYLLGLKGPSLSIDTACSSSLVAVHLACQSLRQKESDVALAGGVNLILSPESSIVFSKTRMLDPEGRCKTFDASANGYARGEGCGVIVLKRLSDAQANGDRILALIRGSAVNHNGRSSSLISPNGPAQQAVIHNALNNGKVSPSQVSYVEVQGTGTSFGEPIEIGALEAVYCRNRSSDNPLAIGSVKTNIGHLEGAAGIASLIKVVLAMQSNTIPAHLNLKELNPYIDWQNLPITIPRVSLAWPNQNTQKFAGVSAFGFSGTNAHLVLEEAPTLNFQSAQLDNFEITERTHHLLELSAKTPWSLEHLAKKYIDYITQNPDIALADLCFNANSGRSHFVHRLAIVASDLKTLKEKLIAFVEQRQAEGVFTGQAASLPRIGAFFSGDISSALTLNYELYKSQPVFKEIISQCEDFLNKYLAFSLLDELDGKQDQNSLIHQSAYRPILLFVLQYALFEQWKAWGIEIAAVMGQSVGEYAAACAAGVLSWQDGLKLIVESSGLALRQEMIEEFKLMIKDLKFSLPVMPLISGSTGTVVTDQFTTLEDWFKHLSKKENTQFMTREIVGSKLEQQGCNVLFEIGIESFLSELNLHKIPQLKHLISLNYSSNNWKIIFDYLAKLYVCGTQINWKEIDKSYFRQRISLPNYAWEKQRYWVALEDDNTEDEISLSKNISHFEDLIKNLASSPELNADEVAFLPKLAELLKRESQKQTPDEQAYSGENITLKAISRKAEDIQSWLAERIAKELGVNASEIDVRVPFDSYGLDSVLAIGIASAAKQYFNIEVTPMLLVHFPTIETLSKYVSEQLEASDLEVFEI